jgi:Zn-dependent metalloprotease
MGQLLYRNFLDNLGVPTMPGFESLKFHVSDPTPEKRTPSRSAALPPPKDASFSSPEQAARYHLHDLLRRDGRRVMRGVAPADGADLVPGLEHERSQSIRWPDVAAKTLRTGLQKGTAPATTIVRFRQVQAGIPVFGSAATVEMDSKNRLLSSDVKLADVEHVSPVAKISDADALQAIVRLTGTQPEKLAGINGSLTYFGRESSDEWRLAWYYRSVPAAPAGFKGGPGHGFSGESPRDLHGCFDYFVDAIDGTVLFWYRANAALKPDSSKPLPAPKQVPFTPAGAKGYDESGNIRDFVGRRINDPCCIEMHDELARVKTFDLQFGFYDLQPPPVYPVRNTTADFGRENTAAVSAHINAKKVMAFYRGFLSRSGIDDNNMDVISFVNCCDHAGDKREWRQAVWFENRMYYGQWLAGDGSLRSYASYLDVIAHELTHGVTQYTANLKYVGESGALDESFADIFGIAIANTDAHGEPPPATEWSWQIGLGLGPGGGPLRDLSKPNPAHLKDFIKPENGGDAEVHALSAIHSKAVQTIFTARNDAGAPLFRWQDLVYLYYVTLCRLPECATFRMARELLIESAKTFYSGRPNEEQTLLMAAIAKAYDEVGIQ